MSGYIYFNELKQFVYLPFSCVTYTMTSSFAMTNEKKVAVKQFEHSSLFATLANSYSVTQLYHIEA
jgi:hypothetical protein